MMIQKEVWIGISGKTLQYWIAKGYEDQIPRVERKKRGKKLFVPKGTKILVKVEHLYRGSGVKVLCKCDVCGRERMLAYGDYLDKYEIRKIDMCNKCSKNTEEALKRYREFMLGENNPWRGKHHTEEFKQHLSETNSGENSPRWKGGKLLSNYNNKLCAACLILHNVGKNNPNWNPDKTDEERINERIISGYKEWRTSVFERDDYICQISGQVGGKLVAHHIKNWANNKDLRLVIENGITMTKELHREFHKIYGIKNNTKEQLDEFIKYKDIKNGIFN